MRMMFNQVFIKTGFSKIFIFEIDFDSSELVDGSIFCFHLTLGGQVKVPEKRSQWPTGGNRSSYGRKIPFGRKTYDKICTQINSYLRYCNRYLGKVAKRREIGKKNCYYFSSNEEDDTVCRL